MSLDARELSSAVVPDYTDPFADLHELPVGEHVARFEAVHDALRARLAGEQTNGGSA